jgi:hypothetical protein
MRAVFILSAFPLLLCLPSIVNPQVQITTESHSCEGQIEWQPPACEAAWQPDVSAVFLGLATDVREEDVPVILDGQRVQTLRLYVTFRVEEAFRGVSDKVVIVVSGGDLCGFPFRKGNKYLVYGRRLSDGEIYVSISSATKFEKEAAADLKYLRGLATAPSGGVIYGSVYRYTSPENPRIMVRRGTPDVGREIEIHGTSRIYQTVVDSHGNFKMSGLPPGRYTILLNANGAIYFPPQSKTVDVADKGCARFDFWIDPFAKEKPSS